MTGIDRPEAVVCERRPWARAVQLKVAEKNNTMVVPGTMREVAALVGSAMTRCGAAPVKHAADRLQALQKLG